MKIWRTGKTAWLGAAVAGAWLLTAAGTGQAAGSQVATAANEAAQLAAQPTTDRSTRRNVTLDEVFREALWRKSVFPLASQGGQQRTPSAVGTGQQPRN